MGPVLRLPGRHRDQGRWIDDGGAGSVLGCRHRRVSGLLPAVSVVGRAVTIIETAPAAERARLGLRLAAMRERTSPNDPLVEALRILARTVVELVEALEEARS